ncbi:MAG: S41 family peptidase [Fuerstiella sp.]
MMTLNKYIFAALAVVLTSATSQAQYSSDYRNPGFDDRSPYGNSGLDDFSAPRDYGRSGYGTSSYGSPGSDWYPRDAYPASRYEDAALSDTGFNVRGRLQHELSRLRNGYDYQAPLDRAVDDTFRNPAPSDYRSDRDRDYRSGGSRLSDGYAPSRLEDPFRLPSTFDNQGESRYRNAPLSRDRGSYTDYESRYRIPLERIDYSNYDRDYRPTDRPRMDLPPSDFEPNGGYNNGIPQQHRNDRLQPGLDPFTPPLPRRDTDNEAESIFKAISARYGNPVNVRAVRAMSATQALALYREVSEQTDQRHLEPSSYDLRVRRGLRNLGLALENPTFKQALGIQADSFRLDGFRSTLSRIEDSMQIAGFSDAQRTVQTVMQEAQNVPGLSASIVAFEFAGATVDTLDKFSALEPAEPGRGASLDLERAEQVRSAMLEGQIVGIGVEVKAHDDGLLIMKALRGGPAAEAGLQSGDIITAIDGRSISGMPMTGSVDLMKGSAGSRIQLRVVRDGSRGGDVTLTRRVVRIYTVNDVRLQPGTDKVAYISLSQFGQKSTEELDQALQQMYNSGMKSLILDLRGNPGGLLNVCVDITDRFLPCGTIVSTKGRLASDNMMETATYNRTWNTPLVVLIDGDSASASEIFAAAVQDNRRGIVVGERSYGKGTVQTHFPLSSVSGNLRLTTARFYSPNGRAMSGQGVTPDVEVADADGPANGDRVLEEAVRIAQSQQLKDIAQAASRCRPTTGQQLQRNSFRDNIYDLNTPQTVLR